MLALQTNTKKWEPLFYDENCTLQYRTAIALLGKLSFTGYEHVLDIGAGTGKITHYISQIVPNGTIVGLDISAEMIQFAQRRYKAPNLSFVQQDVLEMNYKNCFDVILSFWALSWVADQKLAIKNVVNALKPGGRMFLMYPMRHDAYDVAGKIIAYPKWKKYFEGYPSPRPFVTEAEYRELLHSIGEAKISVTQKELPCEFESYSEMQASIRSWMAYLDRLPDERLKQEFLDEFTQAYVKHRKVNRPIMYFSILEISGFKFELNKVVKNSVATVDCKQKENDQFLSGAKSSQSLIRARL
jgi:trans-aconitate methyltransferase